jgi:hypothetical protein
MKLTKIAAGVSAALACGIACAAGVAPYNTLPVTGTEMYFSGSTASDPLFRVFMAKNCDSGTLDAYRADSSLGMTQYLYVCTSSAGFGGAGGPKGYIMVHKSGTSSSDGVVPVANQTAIPYLTQTDVKNNLASFNGTNVPAAPPINTYNSFQLPTGTYLADSGSVVPNVGVSDVEPKFFTTQAIASKLSTTKDYQLIFGAIMTKTARNALQAAENLTVGSDTLANMPTLTQKDLSSIYTGVVTDLQYFGTPNSEPIYIARRSTGSGTTKTFDITFANNACGGSLPLKAPNGTATNSSACTGSNGTIIQLGTSEDLEACMNNFQAANIAAIGEISSDYQPASTDGWRFIRIDGYAPANINTAEGAYPLWAEGTLNVNTSVTLPSALNSILQTLITETKNPTTLSALNSGLSQPIEGYNAGFLVLASNASYANFPLTTAQVTATPIALFTHGTDSCAFATSASGADPADPTGKNPVAYIPE